MFNGEIYNFKSLNKKYLNNIYKNTSDTDINRIILKNRN